MDIQMIVLIGMSVMLVIKIVYSGLLLKRSDHEASSLSLVTITTHGRELAIKLEVIHSFVPS